MRANLFRQRDHAAYTMFFVAEHFLGRHRMNGAIEKLRKGLQSRMVQSVERLGEGRVIPVPRVSGDLDPGEFYEKYVKPGVPVVFERAARDWPCSKRWDFEFFRKNYGEEPVLLVSREASGEDSLQEAFERTTLGAIIDNLGQKNQRYARFSPLFEKHKELRQDVECDWMVSRMLGSLKKHEMRYLLFFLGGAGTKTGIHNAFHDNLLLQIQGKKRWWIWPTTHTPVFHPEANRSPYKSCDLDPQNPDLDKYPMYHHVDRYETTLEPTDVLYNPAYYWHCVENLTDSIAVGMRWANWPRALRSSPMLSALEFLNTKPFIWKGLKSVTDDFNKLLAANAVTKSQHQTMSAPT